MTRILILIFVVLTLNLRISKSQDWTVPEDKSGKVASFKFNDSIKQTGEMVFMRNCISCHGTPGQGNFVKLVPPPGDPATDKFQKQTDGALFFKITTGKGAMPSFKDILTEKERWSVISYFRSFNKNYVQPEPVAVPAGKYGGMDISVKIDFDSTSKQFTAFVNGIKGNDSTAIAGLELSLYAKRYFGQLLIDEPKTTNEQGKAVFNYISVLPGDTAGNLVVFVKINAEGLSDLKKEVSVKAGSPMTAKSLIDTRAMWTISSKAPIWLILSYALVVIAVWSFLIYIVLQIVKISKIGKQNIQE